MKKWICPVILMLLCTALLPHPIFAAGEWRHDHPTQLILTEPAPLYDSNDFATRLSADITPQTVHVTDAWVYTPDWYRIETWLGPKWIYAPTAIPHEPDFKPRMLKLGVPFNLYDEPFANQKTGILLSPQVVEAIDIGFHFYKIKTWLGDKWIMIPGLEDLDNLMDITDVKQTNENIILTTETKLYRSPTLASKDVGTIAPQTVQAFEKVDRPGSPEMEHWYHIKSDWVGEAWIKVVAVSAN